MCVLFLKTVAQYLQLKSAMVEVSARAGEVTGAKGSDVPKAKVEEVAGNVTDETAITGRLLEQTKVPSDDLATYLDNIDSKAAQEFRETDKWPTDQQIPKDPSVLTPEGKIDWSQTPENGFVLDEAGKAIKEDYIPKVGEVFDRYGPDSGRFTSPVIDGKPFTYDQRSLPYLEDASKYHQYEVIGDMSDIRKAIDSAPDNVKNIVEEYVRRYEVDLHVKSGKIAPAFGASGGGTQWQMPLPIKMLEDLKLVKLVK